MRMAKICLAAFQAAFLVMMLSCSNSEDIQEKSVLKEKQDEIAQEVIDSIKVPLDQAKEAGRLANEHNRQVEEARKQE